MFYISISGFASMSALRNSRRKKARGESGAQRRHSAGKLSQTEQICHNSICRSLYRPVHCSCGGGIDLQFFSLCKYSRIRGPAQQKPDLRVPAASPSRKAIDRTCPTARLKVSYNNSLRPFCGRTDDRVSLMTPGDGLTSPKNAICEWCTNVPVRCGIL